MTLAPPKLDDRDFNDLMREAQRWLDQHAPEWTDRTPGDPGIVLLELFAHLTDMMLYRLNQLPEKAYVQFLQLIGVRLQPPSAARVTLRFSTTRSSTEPVVVPRGTRVSSSRADPAGETPVFVTVEPATIAPGASGADVLAYHCEVIDGELAGTGSGLPGQTVTAQRPPIVLPTGDGLDLVVGVEATAEELGGRPAGIEHDGKPFRVWEEADSFARGGPDAYVYVVDRLSGLITFAPAVRGMGPDGALAEAPQAMAAVPPAGREIRLWYRRGGGPAGNATPGTVTVMRTPIPGLDVTNPEPGTGGRAAETLENALLRGPQELHATQRAVTASDYEALAQRYSGAVARARALTRAATWRHASPGTVEVLLVPQVADDARPGGRVSAPVMHEHETEPAREQIQRALDERRPMGTHCMVGWARYKTVKVRARVVVRREEDLEAVKRRVEERLYQTISPLPTRENRVGWRFGQALRASNVFDVVLREPGARFADSVRLVVEEVPDSKVETVEADAFQPNTWYAGAIDSLYRSLDGGGGWELTARFSGEAIKRVRAHHERPGFVAVVTTMPDGQSSRIHVSQDCGETWDPQVPAAGIVIRDLALAMRDDVPVLLLASDSGLYELAWQDGATPLQVLVSQQDQTRGFYAVAASKDVRGAVHVAVAAQGTGGVYLSTGDWNAGKFIGVGLSGEDVRTLEVQQVGARSFLWAGVAATGEAPGKGCFSSELTSDQTVATWVPRDAGWNAGSCWSIAFMSDTVLAATHRGGVLRLDFSAADAVWAANQVHCGLPLRDPSRFLEVNAVAADPAGRYAMAAGDVGVFRTDDDGDNYVESSKREFGETVTLPATWLFCSGLHEISVVSESAAG
jgi:hypothetical protein